MFNDPTNANSIYYTNGYAPSKVFDVLTENWKNNLLAYRSDIDLLRHDKSTHQIYTFCGGNNSGSGLHFDPLSFGYMVMVKDSLLVDKSSEKTILWFSDSETKGISFEEFTKYFSDS